MNTITKTIGLLTLSTLLNFVNAAQMVAVNPVAPTTDIDTVIGFTINETADEEAQQGFGGGSNIKITIFLSNLELRVNPSEITTALSPYFSASESGPDIILSQEAIIPAGFGGNGLVVTIPVSRIGTGIVGFEVGMVAPVISTRIPKSTDNLEGICLDSICLEGGGGDATPPNYSIGMEIASGGNNLGASESKILPLNIIVTETANAANTAGNNVVVALAKDSRIDSVASDCGGADWSLDSTTSSVAYLFTYTANNNAFPANTPSTIVCPVTVTRPTTQSGKLQLNAVLRHGSGDTKTSNDVASIEVTYN